MKLSDRIKAWWRSVSPAEWDLITTLRDLYRMVSSSPAIAMALLERLPAIIEVMKRLEAELPVGGAGAVKFARLISWLEENHGESLRRVAKWEAILAAVKPLVAVLVALLNNAGLFRKDNP